MEITFIIGWKTLGVFFVLSLFLGLNRHLVVNRKLIRDKNKGYTVGVFDDEPSRATCVFVLTEQIYLQVSHLEIIDGDVSKTPMGGRLTDYTANEGTWVGLGIYRAR